MWKLQWISILQYVLKMIPFMKALELRLTDFSGPLDLLLALIEESKLTISDISLSEVTEQFLVYIDGLEEKNPEELADFLVVASKLILIKARSLLPQFASEDAPEGPAHEDQLRLYRLFVDASKEINARWGSGQRSISRVEPIRAVEEFIWPENVSPETLEHVMKKIIGRLTPRKPLPQTTIDRTISIRERIRHIRTVLEKQSRLNFQDILDSEQQNRTNIIVSFLAILELVKQEHLTLKQSGNFSEITLHHVNA